MLDLRINKHANTLLSILCVAGEFPSHSLDLLGNRKRMLELVSKMQKKQKIFFSQFPVDGPAGNAPSSELNTSSVNGVLIHRKGSGQNGSIRFSKNGAELMKEISPVECEYFDGLGCMINGRYGNESMHIDRDHRVAEAAAMMAGAGIEYRPGHVPSLTGAAHQWPSSAFYTSRMLKNKENTRNDTSSASRYVGMIMTPTDAFVVYNTRAAMMAWRGATESKTLNALAYVAGLNREVMQLSSVILLGEPQMLPQYLNLYANARREAYTLFTLYKSVHFVPLTTEGMMILQLMAQPGWNETMLSSVFKPDERVAGEAYDGTRYGKKVICIMDGDISRLIRFRASAGGSHDTIILCPEGYKDAFEEFLDDAAEVRAIPAGALVGR